MTVIGVHIYILFMLWGPGTTLYSNANYILNVHPENEIELQGIIVDATQTKIGRDFYDLFYQNWNPPESVAKLPITIYENPLPGRGTRVTVKVEDSIVYQQFLQARYEVIEENAKYAVSKVISYLEVYEQVQKQLQGDDLMGTGIY